MGSDQLLVVYPCQENQSVDEQNRGGIAFNSSTFASNPGERKQDDQWVSFATVIIDLAIFRGFRHVLIYGSIENKRQANDVVAIQKQWKLLFSFAIQHCVIWFAVILAEYLRYYSK